MNDSSPTTLKTFVVTLALAAIIANWIPGIDDAAETYLEDSMADSLIVYASARGLNGIISVIQSVHLSISVGAGVGLNLGEVLDPLNDLIERFSTFVLYGLAAIGLQKLVLLASTSLIMKCLTTAAIMAGVIVWWRTPGKLVWLVRLALMIALVRFFLVIQVGTVATLDSLYFDERTRHAQSALELARDELNDVRSRYMESIKESGIIKGVWEAGSGVIEDDEGQGATDLATGAIVELIVIMLVRSIIMPLLFLWLLISLLRSLSRADRPMITQTYY